MITLLPVDKVDMAWPELSKYIQSGIDKTGSETTLAKYFQMVRTGNCMLFVFQDNNAPYGALIAEIINTRYGETAHIWAFGSERTVNYEVEFAKLWCFFKELGVNRVMCEGRKGFQKIFPKSRISRYVYEMDI